MAQGKGGYGLKMRFNVKLTVVSPRQKCGMARDINQPSENNKPYLPTSPPSSPYTSPAYVFPPAKLKLDFDPKIAPASTATMKVGHYIRSEIKYGLHYYYYIIQGSPRDGVYLI